MKTSFSIQFTFRQFLQLILVLLAFSVFFVIGTAFSNELKFVPKGPTSNFFFNQINLAVENVIAAWYSSMLLLLIALAALFCYFIELQRNANTRTKILNLGWLVLSFIFFTLSLDEMGSFHELIVQRAIFYQIGFSNEKSWYVLYFLILLGASFMITFFISKIKTSKRSFVFLMMGTLLFLSNPFQEAIEISDYRSATDPNIWKRPTSLLLLEEGSEIFGMLCFFSAMVLYAFDYDRRFMQSKHGINLTMRFIPSNLLGYSISVWLFGLLLMTIHFLYFNHIIKGDDGIAENWFPSAGFFLVVLVALYKTLNSKPNRIRNYYILLASLALFHSLYFGSNIYASELVFKAFFIGLSPHHLILYLNICIGGLLFARFNHYWCRVTLLIFLFISFFQFFTFSAPTLFFGYISASLLFYALMINILRKPSKSTFAVTRKAA